MFLPVFLRVPPVRARSFSDLFPPRPTRLGQTTPGQAIRLVANPP